jgi:mycothiol synthase
MFTFRPFDYTDADYKAMTLIDSALFPEYPMTAEQWQHIDDTRSPEHFFRRDMIERDGEPVAFGFYEQSPGAVEDRKWHCHIFVHPERDHPDIRPHYLAHVLNVLAGRQPAALLSGMLEDREADMRFFAEHGFQKVMRYPQSILDVTAFDPTPFAPVLKNVRVAGVRIVSLRELPEIDPDWKHKLYELEWELAQDVPSIVPPVKRSFEEFEQGVLNAPNFTPDGFFVALDGDQFVGLSQVRLNPAKPEMLETGLTGVIRSHRRRKIATVLKLHGIDFARRSGAAAIVTGNEENNPMYYLNLSLGFVSQPAWVEVEKVLEPALTQEAEHV